MSATEILSFIGGLGVPLLGIANGWLMFWFTNMNRRIDDSEKASSKRIDGVEIAVNLLATSLNEFRVKVAQDYAPNSYMRDVESRLIARLDRIEGKIDRMPHGDRPAP